MLCTCPPRVESHFPSPVELLYSSPSPSQGYMFCRFFLLIPDPQTVLEDYFYVEIALCSLCGFNIFWCKGCFYYGYLLPPSSVFAGHYPFDRRCDWSCGDQNLHWILSGASLLLCSCHCPTVLSGVGYALFFPSIFHPTQVFLFLLVVWGPLIVFSGCSMRTGPFVDVFLMYLCGEVNSRSSYSAILTHPF